MLRVLIFFLLACVPLCHASETPPDVSDSGWIEILPSRTRYEIMIPDPPPAPKRKRFWTGRYDQSFSWLPRKVLEQQEERKPAPHPLRTSQFTLFLKWHGKREKQQPHKFSKTMTVDFATNGYVQSWTQEGEVWASGRWEQFPWGIKFVLQDTSGVSYMGTAQLHPNPFGKYPKLMQGSVIRSNKAELDERQDLPYLRKSRQWFRPVVASFHGRGIGKDTADLSYSKRGLG